MAWVLFDLDGTLTQSEEGIWNSVRYTAEQTGRPVPDAETLRKFIGPPLQGSFQKYMGMSLEESAEALKIYRGRYNTVGLYENRVYPGIRTVLRTLRQAGFHLGVVTGKPEKPTEGILAHFGLRKWLEVVNCARDALSGEKEQLIRDALPEDPGEVWMVGDRCFDMEGARRAGVHALGVTYGYGSEEELISSGAERLARTPLEILRVLCPDMPLANGAFLSMEGMDGSGKGSQIHDLTETLGRYGFEVQVSREPGGSPIGEKIREILLDPANAEMADETEALLYAASRAQHVREVIRPAVAAGRVLLCDRFLDSSVAYQGGGRRLGVDRVLRINEPAVAGTLPDCTVYLDIGWRQAMDRRLGASVPDRMERAEDSFHARTEAAYRELVSREPSRFLVVAADRPRQDIAAEIAQKVLARLMEIES